MASSRTLGASLPRLLHLSQRRHTPQCPKVASACPTYPVFPSHHWSRGCYTAASSRCRASRTRTSPRGYFHVPGTCLARLRATCHTHAAVFTVYLLQLPLRDANSQPLLCKTANISLGTVKNIYINST